MPVQMPGIDQNVCHEWTENDVNLYNSYSFFLAKTDVDRRKKAETYVKLHKRRPWKPNMGPVMRGVKRNFTPRLRQFATPRALTQQPQMDINKVTETTSDAVLYWHDFESPALYFLPSFQDFLDHVSDFGEDLMKQVTDYEEIFYRTMMFHGTPVLFVCKGTHVEAVQTIPFNFTAQLTANDGKTTAVLAGILAAHPDISHLTMASLADALDKMETNYGVPPWSGTGLPSGDDKALDQKYALITHNEAWTKFSFDPYLQQHKNCDLDVVNDSFRGSIFGRITSKLETQPMYMKADGTFAEPELNVQGNVTLNENEVIPNPEYAEIAQSPYAFSSLHGQFGFEKIDSGPPPAAFTGNKPPHNFPGMQWNGEVYLTKDFLLECVDENTGEVRYKQNNKGRYLRYEATLVMGSFPKQRRNSIFLLHKRKQGM